MSAMTAMIKSEGKLLVRNPGVMVWSTILPLAATIILAAIPGVWAPSDDLGGLSFFEVYRPVLVMFVLAILAMQVLPDVLTRYREMGVLKRLRTTPVAPGLLLFAQLALTLLVAVVCLVLMLVIPTLIGAEPPQNLPAFIVAYLLGGWSFLGVGMLIASLFRNAKVAAGFGTLVFFVMQFFAGLWIQRPLMPGWLRTVSDYTPGGAATAALTDAGSGQWPQLLHMAVMAGWGIVTSLLAIRLFKWE
ncbi:ABC transporter permease [Nakamurella aerolata]|uniref:Transport permease protein n=1 Tax=Nakamurella aerolata TaxID=1656892 RepID=A0A849A889_9ACTN|nr:ABC transporter permease [Nakamurella aerolata]NNG36715.1 ABC transporter permease [Nakamurella aerolata]